ncbi:DNA binding domain-containing protein, excisionase family [Mariniphaga anaerophila]|uniref:DNA binding domain-containing protein, excisionase family n=1 Tax=Mariniphaga anaerophila TaxID=1484053 RepID=A0A1M5ETA8_9BACT|nr:helix-turn-helix domain-containing protein [Mariniphaga anaerophila]SHF82404.1 DNA binding domain-containing protein, excisionase family [Mariniphaga anaerophila]
MSDKIIQLIEITPEQLQEAILNGVKVQIEELKKSFQPVQPTEYLTREEVSKLLKINLSTVHGWTKKGKLNAFYCGNRVYYKRSEVEAAIKPLNQ